MRRTKHENFRIRRLLIPETTLVVIFGDNAQFSKFLEKVEDPTTFETEDLLVYFSTSDVVFICPRK
jgi:hypothetical protein